MSDTAEIALSADVATARRPNLEAKPGYAGLIVFILLLAAGLIYGGRGLVGDISEVGGPPLAIGAFILLGIALLIALGFEFVNGFHDTANAVATVIYTHSLPPMAAVLWSGFFNFLGVVISGGGVAFAIISLLPVELILQVGSAAGYSMIFALLFSAIIWNLGTWGLGLPSSSSHTLIGSIMGVGIANQLMAASGSATAGVDWSQASGTLQALLFSPIIGCALAALLYVVMKATVRDKRLYTAPAGNKPPPLWIRGLLILTCTGVSFAHGGSDGQKGMGLIMLILIGAAPTAYALNRAVPANETPAFVQTVHQAEAVFAGHSAGIWLPVDAARATVGEALRTRDVARPEVFAGLVSISDDIAQQVGVLGSFKRIPAFAVQNVRNDMYMVTDAVRLLGKSGVHFSDQEMASMTALSKALNRGTKFIPGWVKVAVAVALGLGTMVGWKRIVVTVGERIGKSHMTYGQGASAEIIAALTISASQIVSLPVSTTHILSSGVAGTMAASGAGLQWSTVRSIATAWVLTLPASMLLSGGLFYIFRHVF